MTTALSAEDRISAVKWFHRIDFGNGVVSPGGDNSQLKLKRLQFPAQFQGKSFLDIGAWDGFFSFEAERRGASRVLATDSFVWEGKLPGHSKAGFLTARELLQSKVEDLTIDPFDIGPATVGTFDVVLLSGVIYHVRNPWLLIERAASVTRELLIVETETDLSYLRRPAVALFTEGSLVGDRTNFCAPNVPALKTMLRDNGFHRIEVVWKRSKWRVMASALRRLQKYGTSPLISLQQGRCAIHASRT